MNPKYKAELKKSACEAVEMNRKEPGSGYAYAIGILTAIAEDKHMQTAEKMARIRTFLGSFHAEKEGGERNGLPGGEGETGNHVFQMGRSDAVN